MYTHNPHGTTDFYFLTGRETGDRVATIKMRFSRCITEEMRRRLYSYVQRSLSLVTETPCSLTSVRVYGRVY